MRLGPREIAPLKRTTFVLLTVLALTGCAASSVPWHHPTEPKDRWGKDWSACRRVAENQVGYRESEGPFRDFDRAAAKKQVDGLAGACMRDRGYLPGKAK